MKCLNCGYNNISSEVLSLERHIENINARLSNSEEIRKEITGIIKSMIASTAQRQTHSSELAVLLDLEKKLKRMGVEL